MIDTNYAELVKQAEQAVAAVKDPELRRIAFEKIFDALLGTPKSHIEVAKTGKAGAGAKPEQPRKTSRRRAGTQAYLEELVEEGFFVKPKTIAAVKAELGNRGHHIPLTSLSGPLQSLCKHKRLRREKAEAPDGGKKAFAYSNW